MSRDKREFPLTGDHWDDSLLRLIGGFANPAFVDDPGAVEDLLVPLTHRQSRYVMLALFDAVKAQIASKIRDQEIINELVAAICKIGLGISASLETAGPERGA